MPTLNHGKENFFKCLTIPSKQVPGCSKKIPQNNNNNNNNNNNHNSNIPPRPGNTGLMFSRGYSHLMGRGILFSLGWQSF